MVSHGENIAQGIKDYEGTYDEWDLRGIIDEIITLSLLQGRLSKLVYEMKEHAVREYKGASES